MLIGKLLSLFLLIYLIKKKDIFKSPIKRLFYIPLIYFFLNITFDKFILSINLTLINCIIFLLEGYIIFQFVNLANTSRRMHYLINKSDKNNLSIDERINYFVKDGFLTTGETNEDFIVNKKFQYELLSKTTHLFKKIFK
jgi:hypothetical protein